MILIFDVYYKPEGGARAAAIEIENFGSSKVSKSWTKDIPYAATYKSGEFYLRELPCLLSLIEEEIGLEEMKNIHLIITDSYTHFSETHDGLGKKLWETLGEEIPVIGIAKNKWKSETISTEVFRGNSEKPLWVTSVGISQRKAAWKVQWMYGNYRKPEMIKLVDQLSRGL